MNSGRSTSDCYSDEDIQDLVGCGSYKKEPLWLDFSPALPLHAAGGGQEYELREEHFYSPDEGYSTPPEEFAVGSPQKSFPSEGGSLQHAEVSGAGAGRGDGGSVGGSDRAAAQPAALGRGEGGSLGDSYLAERHALTREKDQSSTEGGTVQPDEAAARPAFTRYAFTHLTAKTLIPSLNI